MSRAEIWRFRRNRGTPKPDRDHTAMFLGRPRTSVVLGILKAPTVWPVQRRRPARPRMLARRGIAVWDRVPGAEKSCCLEEVGVRMSNPESSPWALPVQRMLPGNLAEIL